MKRRLSVFCRIVLGLFAFSLPFSAHAWIINDFSTKLDIEPRGTVHVTETITVDFGSDERHGIYRDVPTAYLSQDGNYVFTKIEDVGVLQDGRSGEAEITQSSDTLRIKIGDPNETITGVHVYTITYRETGVLRSFEGFDELYWNATGNDWDTPIITAHATVTVPAMITQAACYKGPDGSTATCDDVSGDGNERTFFARDLGPGSGLTVAVGFPPGTVPILSINPPPTFADALGTSLGLSSLLLAFLFGVLTLLRIWWLYGRDRFLRRSILPGVDSAKTSHNTPEEILPIWLNATTSVEYDAPDGLRPAEIGVLMDERADTRDISATIVDLAAHGYLEITEIPKTWIFGSTDYRFNITGKPHDTLRIYERTLMSRLFEDKSEVLLSSLKNSFYEDLALVKKELYDEVVRRKLFAANPKSVRGSAYALSGITIALGVGGLFLVGSLLSQAATVSLIHSLIAGVSLAAIPLGILGLMCAPFMPRKTGLGRELYQRALGYRMFVSGTEKFRAKFAEDHGLYGAVLPYAIMFGVTHKLATAFKEMGIEPQSPTWYHGTTPFNAAIFATTMGDFSKTLGTAMASAPSSSGSGGGGFSGGGFGGGGGGSW